jgi:6-phosphofructokinase 1
VVVSEGVHLAAGAADGELDDFGHVKLAAAAVGERLAGMIADATGLEARAVVLGHVQRGGTPNAQDRILATRFGSRAADLVAEGGFGRMVALRGDEVADVPLAEAVADLKLVPPERFAVAEPFFG